jgi:tRNA threonylcarbamoyladenosine biosynthesis protein TsaB
VASKIILSVDTATQVCAVALSVDRNVPVELILRHGQTHARNVMGAIDTVLKLARTDILEVDAFAVTQGPGSFTGLRIGISTVKGLALAAGKPVIGIGTLDVLAHQAPAGTELICTMLDARRNEVYWALYRRHADRHLTLQTPQCSRAVDVIDHIDATCCFIGNGSCLYASDIQKRLRFPAQWAPDEQHSLRPAVIARLAARMLENNSFTEAAELMPLYLRRSDAEINRPQAEVPGESQMPINKNR